MAPAAPAAAEQPSETLVNKINGFVNEYISEKDKKEALLVSQSVQWGGVFFCLFTYILHFAALLCILSVG